MAKNRIDSLMTRYREGGRTMISLRFDPDLIDALRRLSDKVGRNRTELLEEAAAKLLQSHGISIGPVKTPAAKRKGAK